MAITYEEMYFINQMDSDTYSECFTCFIYDDWEGESSAPLDQIDDTEKASDAEIERSELEFIINQDNGKPLFCYRLPYHYLKTNDGKLIKSENEN